MSTAPSEALMPAEKSKKKVKKPASGSAVSIKLESDIIVSMAHECEVMDKAAAFAAIPQLAETVDFNYVKLGGVLAVVRSNEWWTEEGFETFRDLLEKRFGIHYRKAMYLLQIYEDLIKSGVEWDQVKSLGWCKLKEVSPVITKENAEEWVAKAEGLTVLQLHDVVAKFKAQDLEASGATPEEITTSTTTITFKVHEDQKDTIKLAVEKARKEAKTEYDAVALEAICLNYLSGGKVTKPKSLKSVIEKYDPEAVLKAFGEVWPDIEIEATLP